MFDQLTFMITVSVALSPPISVTVSLKISASPLWPTFGDVNVGLTALASESVTNGSGPAICSHLYDAIPSSGSVDADASRVTSTPSETCWFGPAFATGGALDQETLTIVVAVDVSEVASVTVSWKVRDAPSMPTLGDVKVGFAALASESVTNGPSVCTQA